MTKNTTYTSNDVEDMQTICWTFIPALMNAMKETSAKAKNPKRIQNVMKSLQNAYVDAMTAEYGKHWSDWSYIMNHIAD